MLGDRQGLKCALVMMTPVSLPRRRSMAYPISTRQRSNTPAEVAPGNWRYYLTFKVPTLPKVPNLKRGGGAGNGNNEFVITLPDEFRYLF